MRLKISQLPPTTENERLRSVFTKTYGRPGSGVSVRIDITARWPEATGASVIGQAIDDIVAAQRAFLGDDALAQILERLEAHAADAEPDPGDDPDISRR